MAKELINPDYLFEVSWEVCNKVGGIYTVIATKSLYLKSQLHKHHIRMFGWTPRVIRISLKTITFTLYGKPRPPLRDSGCGWGVGMSRASP